MINIWFSYIYFVMQDYPCTVFISSDMGYEAPKSLQCCLSLALIHTFVHIGPSRMADGPLPALIACDSKRDPLLLDSRPQSGVETKMAVSTFCVMQNWELHAWKHPSSGMEKRQQQVTLKQAGDLNSKQYSDFPWNSELGQTSKWLCERRPCWAVEDPRGDPEGTGLWEGTLVPLKESEPA